MLRSYALAALLTMAPMSIAASQDLCGAVAGASVIAHDGQFLGKVTSSFDSESIFNEIGQYGSEIGRHSIWNDISRYGSEISALSPFNEIASTPPALVKQGQIVGYLTVNEIQRGAVNPWVLKSCDF